MTFSHFRILLQSTFDSVKELDGLQTCSFDDMDKKRMLLCNLMWVPNITHHMQTCEDRIHCDFENTCNYLRTNSMILDKVMSSTPRPYAMLNTTILDEFPTPNHDPDPDP